MVREDFLSERTSVYWVISDFLWYRIVTATQMSPVLPLYPGPRFLMSLKTFPDSKVYFIECFDVDGELVSLNTF